MQIATLGPSATNYADNGISANHRYQYRVRAYNGLYSVFSESGYIYTTPAAPSSVSASATGPTKVAVAAGGLAPYAAEHQVEHRSASGDWGGSKTAGTFPVDMPSVAGLNYYRVRSGRDGLWSGWCESKGITTVAVPLKPTVSGLPAVYALGADAVVSWTPNHPDGSAQTSAELEVTDPGALHHHRERGGGGRLASVTLGAVGTWRFRVRTHGAHPDWGAWSGYAEVAVAAPPVITVTSPSTDSAVAEVVPFAATWDVVDVTGVASQTLRLLSSDGSPLHAVELVGDVREMIRAGTYLPANLDAYVIELSVRGGSTLSATATRRFTTDYAAPAAPISTVEYTPELGTEVTVIYGRDARASDGGSGPVIPTESASVVRAMPDGTQWLVYLTEWATARKHATPCRRWRPVSSISSPHTARSAPPRRSRCPHSCARTRLPSTSAGPRPASYRSNTTWSGAATTVSTKPWTSPTEARRAACRPRTQRDRHPSRGRCRRPRSAGRTTTRWTRWPAAMRWRGSATRTGAARCARLVSGCLEAFRATWRA